MKNRLFPTPSTALRTSLILLALLLASCAPAAVTDAMPHPLPRLSRAQRLRRRMKRLRWNQPPRPPLRHRFLLPPRAVPTCTPPTQARSTSLPGSCSSWNSSALPEAPAALWRPWFMGSKQSILAGSISSIWMQTTETHSLSSSNLVSSTSLRSTCWMGRGMS
jgi:hypothetical protein